MENKQTALEVVATYYGAFRAGDGAAISSALQNVLDADVTVDSPVIREKFSRALSGMAECVGFELATAPLLKGAVVKAQYVGADNPSHVAIELDIPTPLGIVAVGEFFVVNLEIGKITSIKSTNDPRKLLELASKK